MKQAAYFEVRLQFADDTVYGEVWDYGRGRLVQVQTLSRSVYLTELICDFPKPIRGQYTY